MTGFSTGARWPARELDGVLVKAYLNLGIDWDTRALGPNKYLRSWQQHFEQATHRTNRYLDAADVQGTGMWAIPQGLASAPVRCVDQRTREVHDLRFVAGMPGVERHAGTHALSASFGWAIVCDTR